MDLLERQTNVVFIRNTDSSSEESSYDFYDTCRPPVVGPDLEENAVNPLISFMNQPIDLCSDQEQKDVPTDDSNTFNNKSVSILPHQADETDCFIEFAESIRPLKKIFSREITQRRATNHRFDPSHGQNSKQRLLLKRWSQRQKRRQLLLARHHKTKKQQQRCPKLQTIFNAIVRYFDR